MRSELAGLAAMLADPDMRSMAEEDVQRINADLPEAEHRLAVAMLPRDSADDAAVTDLSEWPSGHAACFGLCA